MQMIKW